MNVIHAFFAASLDIILVVLSFYIYVIVISAILSWLVAFNIINTHNRFVQMLGDFLHRVTEPLLVRIRRFVPMMGGFDVAPFILILIIMFLQSFLRRLAY
jgi:YggT family protein